jgi:hypothetical protein
MNSDAHWGKTEKTEEEKEIYQYLIDERSWTDDDILTDSKGKKYSIDELVGKKVLVGEEIVEVNS